MGRKGPFGSVLLGYVLPSGYYNVKVEGLTEHFSKSGLLMYVADYRVQAPGGAAGKSFTEYFVIGKRPWAPKPNATDDEIEWAAVEDPEAADPETWVRSSGFRRLKARLEAAKYVTNDVADMDVVCDEVVGLELGLRILETVESKPGPYHGKARNEVSSSYELGRETPRLDRDTLPAAKPARTVRIVRDAGEPSMTDDMKWSDDEVPF